MNVKKLIEKHGKDNVLFIDERRPLQQILFIKFTSSNDTLFKVPCVITEERYKIKDNYKITLKPIYPEFETRHYYISDLDSLIEQGIIEVFIKVKS